MISKVYQTIFMAKSALHVHGVKLLQQTPSTPLRCSTECTGVPTESQGIPPRNWQITCAGTSNLTVHGMKLTHYHIVIMIAYFFTVD